jgi:hypothetical protein
VWLDQLLTLLQNFPNLKYNPKASLSSTNLLGASTKVLWSEGREMEWVGSFTQMGGTTKESGKMVRCAALVSCFTKTEALPIKDSGIKACSMEKVLSTTMRLTSQIRIDQYIIWTLIWCKINVFPTKECSSTTRKMAMAPCLSLLDSHLLEPS